MTVDLVNKILLSTVSTISHSVSFYFTNQMNTNKKRSHASLHNIHFDFVKLATDSDRAQKVA